MKRMGHIDTDVYEDLPLDTGLDEDQRQTLFEITERRLYEPEEIVVREGEKSRDIFALKSGAVDVLKMDEGATKRRLAQLEPGAVFGEIAFALGTPRSATVRAAEDSELLWIDGGALETLRRSDKLVAFKVEHNLFRMLAERQFDLNSELLDLMSEDEKEQPDDDKQHAEMRRRLLQKWSF